MLRVQNLTLAYDGRMAVQGLQGTLESGSLTAVVGPNGAGKSTLLNAMVGQLRPVTGSIERDPPQLRIGYLPQQADMDRHFPITVFELVALGAWHALGTTKKVNERVRSNTLSALQEVGLEGFAARRLGTLSVGQMQRALFARVLLMDAPLILLDEPFNAIDTRTTQDLIRVIRRWHAERRTVVAVLHDLEQVRQEFPCCLLLARQLIGWGATSEVLSPQNLARARHIAENWDDTPAWGGRCPGCSDS
jgi:zinc/manganese transport system ATP-binding protein